MKTYKTWEMIKALEDNENMVFYSPVAGYYITKKGNKILYAFDKGSFKNGYGDNWIIFLYDDWTLVREPVTWQEAIQAWTKGKTIKCECPGCGIHGDKCTGSMKTYRGISFSMDSPSLCQTMLTNGTWFILDGDADE